MENLCLLHRVLSQGSLCEKFQGDVVEAALGGLEFGGRRWYITYCNCHSTSSSRRWYAGGAIHVHLLRLAVVVKFAFVLVIDVNGVLVVAMVELT